MIQNKEKVLDRCDLTSSCCEALQDVITTNRSLITLDLSGNKLGESGVKRLCDGLRHPDCALRELRLLGCDMTSSCCEDLQDVITINRSLITLDLSYNKLGDFGVKRLCYGLKHPDCALQELRLCRCDLTSSCCQDLQDVITINTSLITLDLSGNELGDSGVKLLCDGLKDPYCALQELRLDRCNLTSSCCEALQDVITTNRSLITLDLSGNKLGDSGVKRLCDGLRHPDCALRELRLLGCDMTSSCCEDLQDVITINRSLITLDLSYNKLGDFGVKRLCYGLKHPDCALQELRLDGCDLTSSSYEDLQDVITTNRSLNTLDLSGNKLGDSGVKRLLNVPKHPDCSLQELGSSEEPNQTGEEEEKREFSTDSFLDPTLSDIENTFSSAMNIQESTPHCTSSASPGELRRDCQLCGKPPDSDDFQVDPVIAGNTYRIELKSGGLFCCSETGIRFQVTSPVTIEYELDPLHHHMSQIHKHKYEIVGPSFNIKTRGGPGVVSAVYLPHYVCLKGGDVDMSRFKVGHFKNDNMILQTPTRIEPYYVMLENPEFSSLVVLYGLLPRAIAKCIPTHGVLLIYYKDCCECTRIHLYLTPHDISIKKAVDENETFHWVHTPSQTQTVYHKSKYTVKGPPNARIISETLMFGYYPATQLYPFSEIVFERESDIDLSVVAVDENIKVWERKLTKEDIKDLLARQSRSSVPRGDLGSASGDCLPSKTSKLEKTPGDILIFHLCDLERKDFKRFKDKLRDNNSPDYPPIPRGNLKKFCVIDTKNLLIKYYGDHALNLTLDIFKCINLMENAKNLEKDIRQYIDRK
ncbi:NACHT, LRR and PYD domains-containing protein 1-like [Discoglossus pictus]